MDGDQVCQAVLVSNLINKICATEGKKACSFWQAAHLEGINIKITSHFFVLS